MYELAVQKEQLKALTNFSKSSIRDTCQRRIQNSVKYLTFDRVLHTLETSIPEFIHFIPSPSYPSSNVQLSPYLYHPLITLFQIKL